MRISLVLLVMACYCAWFSTDVKAANYLALSMVEDSNVVVVGVVEDWGIRVAKIRINAVLDGTLDRQEIEVGPSQGHGCLGEYPIFTTGEEVVLFLKDDGNGQFTVTSNGYGKVSLQPENRFEDIQAVKKLIEIARLTDVDLKNKLMLAEAESENELLRGVSHRRITREIADSEHKQNDKDALVNLLKSKDKAVKLAALQGLQFIDAKDAISLIVQATQDDDVRVVTAASIALAKYDTFETFHALVALTKNENPNLRARALVDLRQSRHPEATATASLLLNDPISSVRAVATGSIRSFDADTLQKLILLLRDSDDEVRFGAAQALGASRNPIALDPLIDYLRTGDKSAKSYGRVVSSISSLLQTGDESVKKNLQENLKLIVQVVRDGTQYAPFFAVQLLESIGTPEAIEELGKLADSSTSKDIRAAPKRSLDKLEK